MRETVFSVPITGVKVPLIAPSVLNILTYPKFGRLRVTRRHANELCKYLRPSLPRESLRVLHRRYARTQGGRIHFFRIKIKLNEAPWREKNGPHEKSPSTSSRRKDITDVTLLLAGIVNLSAPPLSFAVRFYETPTGCSLVETNNFLRFPRTLLDMIFIFASPNAYRIDASVNNWLAFSRDAYNFETCNIYFTLLSG